MSTNYDIINHKTERRMQISKDEIVDLILLKFNINPTEYIRKPRAGHLGWTNKYLINLIVEHETGPTILLFENCGEQTLNRALHKLITPITGKLNGGNQTYKNKLYHLIEIKTCPKCLLTLSYSQYGKDNANVYGIANYCKSCMSNRNKSFYDSNKDTYHKQYIDSHRSEYNARNAARRAARVSATPSWANLDTIKRIYDCAEGDHVDHIIPLQGEYVSGLHVESNLQYLSPEANLSKGNRYEI